MRITDNDSSRYNVKIAPFDNDRDLVVRVAAHTQWLRRSGQAFRNEPNRKGGKMTWWERFKEWCAEPTGSKHGLIQCDICGEWGERNLNYKYVNTFVHYNKHRGTPYMHHEHIARNLIGKLRAKREA